MYLSEAAALELVPSASCALISITEPKRDAPLADPGGWGALLRVRFADAEYDEQMLEALTLRRKAFSADGKGFPSECTSRAVVAFLMVLRGRSEIDTLYVHCHAGQRRSAAVAKFAARMFGVPFDHGYDCYNKTVYGLLQEPARFAAFDSPPAARGSVISRLFGFLSK